MKGTFVKRYKRFLADIETSDGDRITAYCPATGRMTSCLEPGATVEYLPVEDPDRKLEYDWWSIKMPSSWVIIDTRPANKWLYWNRTAPWLPNSWHTAKWISEPSLQSGGRMDYRLEHRNGKNTWIEVKSVTWCEDGIGYFPDAPTKRGRRHLKELIRIQEGTDSAAIVLISMRSDIREIRPASDIDPEFSDLLKQATKTGVTTVGVESTVDDRTMIMTGQVPVICQ